MAQQVWNMTDISGEEYTLGLYHGEESGNLMVYLNNSIMIIDFKILGDKSYHFYLGNEFMHLKIQKHNTDFIYTLEVDKESDTPYNVALRKQQKTEQIQMIIGLGVVIILLLFFFIIRNF